MKKIVLILLFSLTLFANELNLALKAYSIVKDCDNAYIKGDLKGALLLSAACYVDSDKGKTIIPKETSRKIDLFQEPPPPIIKNW